VRLGLGTGSIETYWWDWRREHGEMKKDVSGESLCPHPQARRCPIGRLVASSYLDSVSGTCHVVLRSPFPGRMRAPFTTGHPLSI